MAGNSRWRVSGRDRCPRCKGRGWIPRFGLEWPLFLLLKFVKRETCPACGGTGRAPWTVEYPS